LIIRKKQNHLSDSRPIFRVSFAFAVTPVASIASQNTAGAAVVFSFRHYAGKRKIEWPAGLFPTVTLVF
jgi:hypothetical protein